MAAMDGAEFREWGEVLERLRVERGLSIGEICRRAPMERSQYYRICHGAKDGPSFMILDRLLKAMGCTWTEWGRTCDALQAGSASRREPVALPAAANEGRARPSKVDTRKPPPSRGAPPPLLRRGHKVIP